MAKNRYCLIAPVIYRSIVLLITIFGLSIAVLTACFAEEFRLAKGAIPSSIKGVRGAIGVTYKDIPDGSIGNNNFIVEGVLSANGGLTIQGVANQSAEDALVPTEGLLWLRTDITPSSSGPIWSVKTTAQSQSYIVCDDTYVYTCGANSTGWEIEKRYKSNGNLVWAQTSDTSISADDAHALTADDTYLYIVGYSYIYPGKGEKWLSNRQWQIEKRRKSDGGLVWTKLSNPTDRWDEAYSIAVDDTYIYVSGDDWNITTDEWELRIEKRYKSDGALVPEPGWPIIENLTSHLDVGFEIKADNDFVYLAGITNGNTSMPVNSDGKWLIEKRAKSGGALEPGWPVIDNLTAGYADCAYSLTVDDMYIYVIGYKYWEWCIEKRAKSGGGLIWKQTIDPNPTSGDTPRAITSDNDYIYTLGDELKTGPEVVWRWRMEKRRKSDGTLEWAMTPHSGVYAGSTKLNSITCDNDYIYVTGFDPVAPMGWLIEKYPKTLVASLDIGLRIWKGTQAVNIAAEDPPVSPLRISVNNKTYGISLASPGSSNDSGIRIKTDFGTWALAKK
ncbi:MAG: hypothetical protein Q7S30_04560 [Candidatus Omnitrophota bacterium]|nr:hypothetical protein [Candidatus Omnitrophota bacterium]